MSIRLKDGIAGNITGNANSATTLQTARTINGTSFNGSANITTANWGTARTITIGNTGKSVNGAGNVTWSLSEIGAASASHSHNSLVTKGNNTINSTANDTTANWGAQGHSVHWYTTAGYLNNQPSQYGYLLNLGSGSEVHQIWMTQASGNLAHRGGNSSGWSGTWRTVLDSSNYSSYAAPASHTHSYLPLSGGTLTGDLKLTKNMTIASSNGRSGSLYADGTGGVTFLSGGKGVESTIDGSGYLSVRGFSSNFEVLTNVAPSITLEAITNNNHNSGGRILFNSSDDQNVQLRHEWYDSHLPPFGLIVERTPDNKGPYTACLKVEGAFVCGVNANFIDNTNKADARIVRGSSDAAGGLKVQMGGTNTTSTFEVVNPNWTTAWFSCSNVGIKSSSYSNFSDERLKTNIEEVDCNISNKINKIKVYNYNYLSDYDKVIPSVVKRDIKCKTTKIKKLETTNDYKISLNSKSNKLCKGMPDKRWGVIAQEVEELFPELITESKTLIDGENKVVKSVDVYGLTVLTLEFAKEIYKENQSLKKEINLIKEKLGL